MSTTIIQQIAPANIEILVRGLSALLTSRKHYQTKFLCHFHPIIEIESEAISNLTLKYSLTTMKKLACSAGVLFGSANDFVRESAMLKPKRGGNESPRTYPQGYYFYSPQSSTVIKSKMAATTVRTRTRFRPPKIRLHCRL